MNRITVPKGGSAVTGPESTAIEAACLGACIAICVSDSIAGISAITIPLVPVMTTLVPPDTDDTLLDVSSGMKKVFQDLMNAGGKKEHMRIWLVGAGRFMEEPGPLALGVQLYSLSKKILQKNALDIHAEHVGGHFDRSVVLESGAEVLNVVLPDGREVAI